MKIVPIAVGKSAKEVSIVPTALVNTPSIAVFTGDNFSSRPSLMPPNLLCIAVFIGAIIGSSLSFILLNAFNTIVVTGANFSAKPSFIAANLVCIAVFTGSNTSPRPSFIDPNFANIAFLTSSNIGATTSLALPKPVPIAVTIGDISPPMSFFMFPNAVDMFFPRFSKASLTLRFWISEINSVMQVTIPPIAVRKGPLVAIMISNPLKIAAMATPITVPTPVSILLHVTRFVSPTIFPTASSTAVLKLGHASSVCLAISVAMSPSAGRAVSVIALPSAKIAGASTSPTSIAARFALFLISSNFAS